MAGSGPCSSSPCKAARSSQCSAARTSSARLAVLPSFAAPRSSSSLQQHAARQRRLQVSTAAASACGSNPNTSGSNFTCTSPNVQWPVLHQYAATAAGAVRWQPPSSRRPGSFIICRDSPPAGASGPSSSNSEGGRDSSAVNSDDAATSSAAHNKRATSPISTAQQPLAGAGYNSNNNNSSSSSSSNPLRSLDPDDLEDMPEPQSAILSSAAAAAAAATLPAVAGSPAGAGIDHTSVGRATAATAAAAAAAAAAEAVMAAAMLAGGSNGGLVGAGAEPSAPSAVFGSTAAGELQDLFTMLKMQVAANSPAVQLTPTLVSIVRCAAANQLTLPFVMAGGRHTLLLQLLASEDHAVAVLAAEAWCRVCGEPNLEPWSEALLPAVPALLSVIGSNSTPEGVKVPLLFFAVSSLVRMATLPAVARSVQDQGGLPLMVAALHVVPAAICQVTTFGLFRLMRELDGDMTDDQLATWNQQQQSQQLQEAGASTDGSSTTTQQQEQRELVLLTYVRAGAFGKLCQVLAHVEEGSAHELAFSMLLSLALIPAAQQLVADQGEVQSLVQVMSNPPSRPVRLQTMLVLGRLAARNRACQQDAVREGVVPVLVDLMVQGSEEERCHACRLLAILGQHETTHQTILDSDAMPVMLQLLRNHGAIIPEGAAQHISVLSQSIEPWQAAAEAAADAAADTTTSDSSSNNSAAGNDDDDGEEDTDGGSSSSGADDSRHHTSGPFKAAKRPGSPSRSAWSGKVVGPELVLEQAAGLACMLCHNADNHFLLVNQGIVPLLVAQLHQGAPPKTVTYTLASLLMLCMGDSRNAAVVARAGAVPGLVSIARESSHRAANRELAAAMLAVMCRSQSAQVDVVASGGIPALTRLLAEGSIGACCSAAEALAQIAATSDVRCRLIVRAGALPHLLPMLQPNSNPNSLLWAARLLKALAQERNTLWEVCETPGLLALLPGILNKRPGQQQLQRLIQEFRSAAAAAAAADVGAAGSDTHDELHQGGVEEAVDESTTGDEDILEKAQANIAWLLAALASDPRTRTIMAELASYLVRPLVVMLRDSQETSGPGYTLHDVLHGMANSRQAAASAALRALSKHVRIAGLIQSEIALQHWMGHNVQLPKAMGEWPPPTPGWFLNVDWWSSEGPPPADDDKAPWA